MSLEVLDWRRQVADLYRNVRAEPDAVAAHALWRERHEILLRTHRASPVPEALRDAYPGPRYGAYDPALRFELAINIDVAPRQLAVETGTDGTVRFARIGRVEIPAAGGLDVWWHEGYGGGLFVPLWDPSPDTYGGGRYLLDTAKGADLGGEVDPRTGRGTLVIDCNFAYNPSCAYDPAWACPLAPDTNRLTRALDTGERAVVGVGG